MGEAFYSFKIFTFFYCAVLHLQANSGPINHVEEKKKILFFFLLLGLWLGLFLFFRHDLNGQEFIYNGLNFDWISLLNLSGGRITMVYSPSI